MIGILEIVGVSLLSMLLFRLIGNGGAGLFIVAYILLRVIWSLAGVAVERERVAKERWEAQHVGETYQPAAGVEIGDLLDGLRRWGLALVRRADRLGTKDR